MSYHESTTRMREYLKNAGVNLKDVRIRTPRDSKGEYRSTEVTVIRDANVIPCIPQILEQGLSVYLIVNKQKIAHVSIKPYGEMLTIRDLDLNVQIELKNGRLSAFDFNTMQMVK